MLIKRLKFLRKIAPQPQVGQALPLGRAGAVEFEEEEDVSRAEARWTRVSSQSHHTRNNIGPLMSSQVKLFMY